MVINTTLKFGPRSNMRSYRTFAIGVERFPIMKESVRYGYPIKEHSR